VVAGVDVLGTVATVSLAMEKLKLPLPAGWRLVSVTRQLTAQVPFGAVARSSTVTVTCPASRSG
jgi:hypothetical protein